jgi:hypothetical protein
MHELLAGNSVKFSMIRSMATQCLVILTSCAFVPVSATVVLKWVDADGLTHYSDEAPDPSTTPVTKIDVPETSSAESNVGNNFYSIKNQWQRLHKERIEYEKLKLEKAKQEAAQQSAKPQIVYIKDPYEKRYVVAYPGSYYRRHNRGRYHKKHKQYSRYASKRHYRGKAPVGLHAGRLKLGSYSQFH